MPGARPAYDLIYFPQPQSDLHEDFGANDFNFRKNPPAINIVARTSITATKID